MIQYQKKAKDPAPSVMNINALQVIDSILGVIELEACACTDDLDVAKIDALIEERLDARTNKDWSRADEIREELLALGVSIKDNSQGTTWTRIVQ